MNRFAIKYLVSVILLIFSLYGCATTRKDPRTESETARTRYCVVPVDSMKRIIGKLEGILNTGNLSLSDMERIESILPACRKMLSAGSDGMSARECRIFMESLILTADLDVEEQKEDKESIISELSSIRKEIHKNFLRGDYDRVIERFEETEKIFGKEVIIPEIELLVILSLGEKNRLQQAADEGSALLTELETFPDVISLISSIVEWELRMGNSDNAIALYEKLVDKVNEKNKLLERAWKNISIYNEDKMRDSEIIDVKTLLTKVEERLSKEEQGLLEVVNRLINEESFSEAKMLLFKWRMRADENFENEIIERALKIVDRAESGNLANGKNDYETTAMNDAQRLIEEEKYDEAVYLLESVSFDSGSIKGRALEMKEMAVEKLINKEHHKAAETFLMAKKSSDPAEKQSLLESSFKILNNLVEKYPSSPLINKINSHIERVKIELETMDR